MPTLADGLAGNLDPETMTFDIVRRFVGEMATAPEHDIRAAMRAIAIEERLIVEGAAATRVYGWPARRRGLLPRTPLRSNRDI